MNETTKKKKKKTFDAHYVKSVGIWSFSGPYFPAFGMNMDQKNSEYGPFLRSDFYEKISCAKKVRKWCPKKKRKL